MAKDTLKELTKKVSEREQLLEKIVNFVEELLHKKGKVLRREVHSAHTYTERELRDFKGFSFYDSGSHTMFGGHDVRIWHQKIMVLDLYYQTSVKECEVNTFQANPEWIKALKAVMRSRDRLLKQAEAKEKRIQMERESATARETQMRAMKDRAERLGL